jgi:hypothetical protein
MEKLREKTRHQSIYGGARISCIVVEKILNRFLYQKKVPYDYSNPISLANPPRLGPHAGPRQLVSSPALAGDADRRPGGVRRHAHCVPKRM